MKIRALTAVVAAVSAVSPASHATAAASSVTLVLDANFADPSFVEVGGVHYAYASGDGFPVASAPSIRGPWTKRGKSMPARPSWTERPASGNRDWAPDVFRRASDGKFIMYYSSYNKADKRQCIGVATSASPLGPFTDPEGHARVCPPNKLPVRDPSPFTKLDGSHWIIYAAGAGQIRATRMTADQTRNAGGDPIILLSQKTITEAPVILRSGPRLVMFTSRNHFEDGCNYKTEAFVSVGLDRGTWKSAGDVLTQKNSGLCGPGGADLVKSGDKTWIMFHAWRGARTHRAMYVGTISWGANNLTPRIE